MKKGIDVSKWQREIDWKLVKNFGVEFAIIREGYGKDCPNQKDTYFARNYNAAKAVGIPVGVYHYSYADSVEDAREEALFCLKNLKGKKLEYPVCFDIEDPTQLKLSNDKRTEICEAFCEEIEKAGYYAMIYCNLNWIKNYLNTKELVSKYDLWLAEWDKEEPSMECGIWQYSEKGKISGIFGDVDLNVAYYDYPSIMKTNGLNGFSVTTNKTQKYLEHAVQKGDTLWDLARKYNTTAAKIAKDNNIKDPDKIYVGQILKI